MKKRSPLLITLSFFLSICSFTSSKACSCGEFPEYCAEAIFAPNFLVEVISQGTAINSGTIDIYYTNVKILINISGDVFPDTMSIINQDGLNCNGSIFHLLPGDSVILSLPFPAIDYNYLPFEYDEIPPYTAYDLNGCGVFRLSVHNGIVSGYNTEQVALEDFIIDRFNNCPISHTATPSTLPRVSIFPNPANDNIHIKNPTKEEVLLNIFNLQGQMLNQFQLKPFEHIIYPIAHLPTGTYLIKQSAKHSEQSVLIVKE